jgi:hypothetical protein
MRIISFIDHAEVIIHAKTQLNDALIESCVLVGTFTVQFSALLRA